MTSQKVKVFCIGAPKTGTTSLGKALRDLGYNHKPYSLELSRETYSSGDYEKVLKEAEKFESFDDGPWNRDNFYQKLDERFPNSKFILTVREMSSWIKSHESHFSSEGTKRIPEELWISNYSDEQRRFHILKHKERIEEILDYFKDRSEQLLVINICGGEGWEKLCPFLDLSIPNKPFPVANVTQSKIVIKTRKIKRFIKKLMSAQINY